MSKHLTISLISAFIIVIGIAVMWRGVDAPTAASRDELLVKMSLPTDLPAMDQRGSSGDATSDYRAAIELYQEHKHDLRRKDPPREIVKQLADHLLAGAQKASVTSGFLDEQLPLEPGARPEYGDAATKVASLALHAVSDADPAEKERVARAAFLYGRRLFDHNVRISPRRAGLVVMATAAMNLEQMLEGDAKRQATKWVDAIGDIQMAWEEKLQGMYRMEESAGDLMRIANYDEDLSFRVEALLQLGVAKYLTDSRNNQRAMENVLEDNVESSEPMLVKAAKAATAFTREQVRQVR